MSHKLKLIERLIQELPPENQPTVDEARLTWFHNIRRDQGLRLSDRGFEVLAIEIGLEYYEFPIEDFLSVSQKTIIDMDRRLRSPYYIFFKKRQIHSVAFFGDEEAVAVRLYNDLVKFIENYS